jgi:hypothetical protein
MLAMRAGHYTDRHVKRGLKSQDARRKRRRSKATKWMIGLVAGGLLAYGVSQMSFVAYGEGDLAAVDFSSLSRSEKRTALQAANQARCTCGCGMTLAQCVATDSTCPVRESNIVKINTMVEQARQPQPTP